jgi:hypothetical protein
MGTGRDASQMTWAFCRVLVAAIFSRFRVVVNYP